MHLKSKNQYPFKPVKQTVGQYVSENFCHCSHECPPERCPIHAYHHINGMVVHPSEIRPPKPLRLKSRRSRWLWLLPAVPLAAWLLQRFAHVVH
jgi:hypothetical protein